MGDIQKVPLFTGSGEIRRLSCLCQMSKRVLARKSGLDSQHTHFHIILNISLCSFFIFDQWKSVHLEILILITYLLLFASGLFGLIRFASYNSLSFHRFRFIRPYSRSLNFIVCAIYCRLD